MSISPLLPDPDFAAGYGLGWAGGYEVGWHRGYGDSEREMAAAWHQMWVRVRAVLAQPTHAELQRRRGEPARLWTSQELEDEVAYWAQASGS